MDPFKLTPVAPGASSFFPTPTEISGGVRWLRDHPVMAAATCAAATAFSMAAYLAMQAKEPVRMLHVAPSAELFPAKPTVSPSDKATEQDSTFDFSDYSELRHHRRRNTMEDDLPECPKSPGYMSLSPLEHAVTADQGDDMGGIGSPEWGWYVSTTPPEDYYPAPAICYGRCE
ncbi:hypothetical protein SPRG_20831 [Saprolegnia parasitica CBS 223.65]|uniref:Uncharacterized protein n=1 Tax=Saprolegnia parasitica (strain CBS 223.65) TaxID=695850 RepID=A0A067C6M3_SAPPC|nr:hypothetical protein SPRG_20831 [Saprolegnia parasitica CBS 223.65]KDO24800.1 hypothetical protein SPRG_20831 [Saprolegnia parasitica CBS 223.65]|eukprot:XP_012204533.1 hypothetical protein SPRG_20831 [Saprolegnia parasitica CBS 223.65]